MRLPFAPLVQSVGLPEERTRLAIRERDNLAQLHKDNVMQSETRSELAKKIDELQREAILSAIREHSSPTMEIAVREISQALVQRKIMPAGMWIRGRVYLLDHAKHIAWVEVQCGLRYVQSPRGAYAYCKRIAEHFGLTRPEDLLAAI